VKFENRYGPLDRFLHRIAFRAGLAQHAMADVEEMLYRRTLDSIRLEKPVFISALPRCGTTILLKVLWETGRFASHTYRDMPFVLCPMLWHRFSRRFTVDDRPRERAHGDGLQISGVSPEAFEEMVWKHFWPAHYGIDRIVPWTSSDRNQEFNEFFEAHMRKVIAIRRDDPTQEMRYLSKNNVNIARLAAPPRTLCRGVFLIPFRAPVQQAASMLQQHRRFSKIHAEDDFVRRYMEAIGHHEFGHGLRPMDFGGWLDEAPPPDRLEFWVRYWIAAYRYVLEHAGPSTLLVSYARLTTEPERSLARLAEAIDIPESDLVSRAGLLRPPRTHRVGQAQVPRSVLDAASAVHERLKRQDAV
jgi:hypothetical protein